MLLDVSLVVLFVLLSVYTVISYNNPELRILLFIKYIIIMLSLLIVGISGKYLSSLYFKLKGLPEYIIIEEI